MFIWTFQIITIALSYQRCEIGAHCGRVTSLSEIADWKHLLNYSFKEYSAVYLVSASLSVPQTKLSDKKILLAFYYSQCFFLFFQQINKGTDSVHICRNRILSILDQLQTFFYIQNNVADRKPLDMCDFVCMCVFIPIASSICWHRAKVDESFSVSAGHLNINYTIIKVKINPPFWDELQRTKFQ